MHTNYANLSILDRKVVEAFLALRDKDRQYLLILHWLGFRQATIDVTQSDRGAGRSSYNFRRLARVAVDGIFFQSTVLLRYVVYTGFFVAAAGGLLAIYAMVVYASGRSLPQWTALPVLILLLTGFIIISTGVTGLYVGKIFEQVKGTAALRGGHQDRGWRRAPRADGARGHRGVLVADLQPPLRDRARVRLHPGGNRQPAPVWARAVRRALRGMAGGVGGVRQGAAHVLLHVGA